jgi:Zn-dependent peptidase ImmA (M78 family)/transcriptional regulator with XRE-family HTH domain
MNVTLNPSVLKWARERAGLSEAQLARKVGTQPEKVTLWEQEGELAYKFVEKLADKTYTPLGYLFLERPPVETLPINDFRTVGSTLIQAPSPDLLETLERAIERQEWFRNYLIGNGAIALDFVGSLKGDEEVEPTAQLISKKFALETRARAQAANWEDALKAHCDQIESEGVLVMRSGIVGENTHRPLNVDEFRGFALSDQYAPLIFINSKDVKAAQIFTLIHELVHLWLGVSGVSNLNETQPAPRPIEQFCNSVAAEILVPSAELKENFYGIEAINDLCQHFKVSILVMLRRLLDLNLIAKQEFARQYSAALARFQKNGQDKKESGGDYYRTKISRLGKKFVSALLESTYEGGTDYGEAFRLLGIRSVEKMARLANELKFDFS